ncbi:hypothetical protein [uncultured Roseobacter sp.]|uniref:hypothetical protein n=1 Tax=uncultured Roseobacter sp. TaxID=114847 RepID=UPI002612DA64|nr:hypothetical protein [uncultured Roseobacter sp.]
MEPNDKPRLKFREYVTLLISVVALTVSLAGFYYSHLRTSLALEAITLEADPAGGVIVYQVAVVNPGNRTALITNARLLQRSAGNVLHASNPLGQVNLSTELPVVLEKNQILVLTFEGPLTLNDMYERGSDPDKGTGLEEFNGEPTRKIWLEATFDAMDFRGVAHTSSAGLLTAHITRREVASWSFDAAKHSIFER